MAKKKIRTKLKLRLRKRKLKRVKIVIQALTPLVRVAMDSHPVWSVVNSKSTKSRAWNGWYLYTITNLMVSWLTKWVWERPFKPFL